MTILVDQVGKAYPKLKGRWHALGTWLGLCKRDQNWIIRDVSFKVGQGESVGIIGVNGAGKSTLLKLITGTAMPTEGTITTTGARPTYSAVSQPAPSRPASTTAGASGVRAA